MSTHQKNDSFQNWLNPSERKPLIQRYLQSPLSIRWSQLVRLLQVVELAESDHNSSS